MSTCPQCGAAADHGLTNRQRPFCSERCRLLDLGAWLDERYAVPAEPATEEDVRGAGPNEALNRDPS
jgi:endogenous inhibitor of DNA gyrase (YacG/DUF329 family)